MINKVWYCDWKMIDDELSQKLTFNNDERKKDMSISIKEMIDELLEYFVEEVRDDVIKKLDFEWEFLVVNNNGVESCLYRFWYLVKGYLRRCGNGFLFRYGRNKKGIENIYSVIY